jgi:hypothetical protein
MQFPGGEGVDLVIWGRYQEVWPGDISGQVLRRVDVRCPAYFNPTHVRLVVKSWNCEAPLIVALKDRVLVANAINSNGCCWNTNARHLVIKNDESCTTYESWVNNIHAGTSASVNLSCVETGNIAVEVRYSDFNGTWFSWRHCSCRCELNLKGGLVVLTKLIWGACYWDRCIRHSRQVDRHCLNLQNVWSYRARCITVRSHCHIKLLRRVGGVEVWNT